MLFNIDKYIITYDISRSLRVGDSRIQAILRHGVRKHLTDVVRASRAICTL